ncbi:MAG: DUF2336 domain-containing protein [Phenylobacterium sp.]|nr:DUF2336 domain-containing protein [Phenylobacterium sp.]MDP3173914.1 DUF2336 domain-containing protein [Phenylobacterium sp.]
MGVAASTDSLLQLARSRAPADRGHLLLALVELCDTSQSGRVMNAPPVQALLSSIFMSVVVEAERDIRKRLAEKLASAAWAPAALVNVLALDDIEIAAPIIAASPVLKDQDLVRLLLEATLDHQIEVARRPRLGPPVVAAILQQAEPAVLTALAANTATHLTPADMVKLVEASRRIASLRSPLVRHPELTTDLAQQLYVWIGQSLRQSLASRFRLDTAALDAALADAVREAHGGIVEEAPSAVVWTREDEREDMERRLVAKLQSAGQLRPGYLLRALRERKLSLFVTALAALGRFEADDVRRAIDSKQPELLGLACAAVAIDRSVFPTILDLVRRLNGGHPDGGDEGARRAIGAFGSFSPAVAGAAFRQAIRTV